MKELKEKKKTLFDGVYDAWIYKMHPNFCRANQEKNEILISNEMKLMK